MSSAEEYKQEGNKYYVQGKYFDAIDQYTLAIETDPEQSAYYGNRAAAYIGLKKWNKAIEDCNQAIDLNPEFTKAHIRLGVCFTNTGDYYHAKESLQRALQIEPESSLARQSLANVIKAEELLKRGRDAYKDGMYSLSLNAYQQMLSISDSEIASIGVAEALIQLGKESEALIIVRGILRINSSNLEALYLMALCLCSTGDLDGGQKILVQILRRAPDMTKAAKLRKKVRSLLAKKQEGNAAFSSRQYEEAYSIYSEALEIAPELKVMSSVLLANRSAVSKAMKNYEEAVNDLTEAIELDPNYRKAYIRRGQCYVELERFEEAILDYEHVLAEDPDDKDLKRLIREAKHQEKLSKRKNYYKILGVEKDATEREIKKAYRKMALVLHPDKPEGDEEKFKELSEAYTVLSDPEKRAAWDRGDDLEGGMDFSDMFRQGGGFPGGFGGGGFGGGGFSGGFGGGGFGGFPF